jgi:hypothetical protein
MQQQIHAGALDPYFFQLVVTSDQEFDLSLVTAPCVFEVLDEASYENDAPPGGPRQWAATPSNAQQTAGGSSVTLTHVYQVGDVPTPGTLLIRAVITHPSYANPIVTPAIPLLVVQRFAP